MNLRQYHSAKIKRQALSRERKIDLSHIGNFSLDEDMASRRNCENMIGITQIPLGVAGPLNIKGGYAQGIFYIPLSTTEGALIASISRGCKAISQNGEATVLVENVGVSRAPVFRVSGIKAGQEFIIWVKQHYAKIKKIAESTSSHLKLKEVKSHLVGRNVYLRFVFDSADAMGMNMVTIAVQKVVDDFLTKQSRVKCVAISGNLCVDKKANLLNFIEGRGKKVWAEVVLQREIVKDILKTTPEDIVEVWQRKVVMGSLLSGTIGANSHIANVLAALFLACGQDLAHLTEGSMGITTTEIIGRDLYVSVYLPDLMIGTVGGGTMLATQKEALSILGIPDTRLGVGQQVLKLAEIMGAVVLAGEISLMASLAEGSLARAHQKLGRGK